MKRQPVAVWGGKPLALGSNPGLGPMEAWEYGLQMTVAEPDRGLKWLDAQSTLALRTLGRAARLPPDRMLCQFKMPQAR